MSRLSKKPIKLPEKVAVKLDGEYLVATGPLGEKRVKISKTVTVKVDADSINVQLLNKESGSKADDGTAWSLIKNAVEGVSTGFSRILEIEGVGYRAVAEGKTLVLYLGYAEPVRLGIPDGVDVKVEKNVFTISGIDKDLVGRVAASIRALKKPEPYKGKGIHYKGEIIRRKVGKKAAAAGASS